MKLTFLSNNFLIYVLDLKKFTRCVTIFYNTKLQYEMYATYANMESIPNTIYDTILTMIHKPRVFNIVTR